MLIWHYLIIFAEVVVALSLLYFRFCLYESEEGHLQSALADMWVRSADHSESTRAKFGRLLVESARVSVAFVDSLLGPQLLSIRAVLTYGCLILIGGMLTNALIQVIAATFTTDIQQKLVGFGVLIFTILLFFFVALAPVTIKKRWAQFVPTIIFLLFLTGLLVTRAYTSLVALGAVLAVDYLWVLFIRRQLERALIRGSRVRHVLILVEGLVVSVVFFVTFPGKYHPGLIADEWVWGHSEFLRDAIFGLSDSRFCFAVVSLVQLGVLAFGFLNWMAWSFLSRIIYAAERYQFFRERKWFATIGIALLIHSASGGGWIKSLVETIGKTVGG